MGEKKGRTLTNGRRNTDDRQQKREDRAKIHLNRIHNLKQASSSHPQSRIKKKCDDPIKEAGKGPKENILQYRSASSTFTAVVCS